MGLLRYLRGDELLEDRSTQPAGEARTLAMGGQSEAFLYPTHTTPLVASRTCSGSPLPGRASALGGSSGSIPAGCRATAFARARTGVDAGFGGPSWR